MNSIRKPMLYPLSCEGLACTFAQHAGRGSVRWARVDYPARARVCAACRGPASDHRPDIPICGTDCTAGGGGSSLQPVVVTEGPRHPRVLGRSSVAANCL